MKKYFIVAVLILALAVPAMAADLKVSGSMRMRGFYQDNAALLNDTSGNIAAEKSDAWYDFRIRPVFTIKVNDNINITTRVRIFGASTNSGNELFGNTAGALGGKNDNASWDRGFASIKTPWGMLDIGRMTGGVWANDIFDIESARDRIKYTMPIGNFTLIGIIEKNAEIDSQVVNADFFGNLSTAEDQDADAYYLAGIYKMENITMGLLYGYARSTATIAGIQNAVQPWGQNTLISDHLYLPYVNAKFGNFGLKLEGHIRNGTQEIDGATPDRDRTGTAFWGEGTGAFGPITGILGYSWSSGDPNPADTDDEQGSSWGTEYTPLVILTDVDSLIMAGNNTVGGVTVNGIQNGTLTGKGYQVLYGGVDYALTESLNITGLVAQAWVDEQQGALDDEVGTEFDIKVLWKAMPNLTYGVYWGWLNTGEMFKSLLFSNNIDDTWTLYHELEITF